MRYLDVVHTYICTYKSEIEHVKGEGEREIKRE
jgi:hypothetical protein